MALIPCHTSSELLLVNKSTMFGKLSKNSSSINRNREHWKMTNSIHCMTLIVDFVKTDCGIHKEVLKLLHTIGTAQILKYIYI